MIKRFAICIAALLFPVSSQATPLVADLSNYRIHIDSSFTGTNIFLFGARNDNGDIVVIVRGPEKNFLLRKKEPIAGVWVNRDRIKFYNVPQYYAIASSKPLTDIEQIALFGQLGIGQEAVLSTPSRLTRRSDAAEFEQAFLQYQFNHGLYNKGVIPIRFMGETLFKTLIEFPDDIPSGAYTAEIYLISDGEVVGMQSTPINVVKRGLEAFLFANAHDHPALYGISAVVLALAMGWFAGRIFEHV